MFVKQAFDLLWRSFRAEGNNWDPGALNCSDKLPTFHFPLYRRCIFRDGGSQTCPNRAAEGDLGQHLVLAQVPQKAFWGILGAGAAPQLPEPPQPWHHYTPRAGTQLNILPLLRECAETLCTASQGDGKSGTRAASACTQRSPRSAYGNAFPHFPEFSVEKTCFNLGWDFPGAGDLSVCPSVGVQPLPPL